jgi:hypothetical protein
MVASKTTPPDGGARIDDADHGNPQDPSGRGSADIDIYEAAL